MEKGQVHGQGRRVLAAAGVLGLAVIAVSSSYAGDKKAAAAPSRPAAPAKPASAPRPAGGGGAAAHGPSGAATHTGPTTGGAHSGPTAGGAHTGPTTSNPHTGPTTSSPGSHATTTAGHSPTTAEGHGGATTAGHNNAPGAGAHAGAGGEHAGGAGAGMGGEHAGAGGAHAGSGMSRSATGHIAPASSHTFATSHGAVTRRADGHIRDVHDSRRGMDVHRGLDGHRRVMVERGDHSRVYAERGRPGYVERRYGYGGHDYARRSYYWHGHEYPRYYRGYYYHGAYMNVYAPAYYYAPAFYGWAYNPWATPVVYGGWGWAGNPWYGYYGYYFAPYPVYAGPAFWLTDYLIAAEMQAAFAARAEAAAAEGKTLPPCEPGYCANGSGVELAGLGTPAAWADAGKGPSMSPEVKQLISDEVKAQIALENAEAQGNAKGQDADPASSGIERMLSDGKMHVFVAGASLDVVDSNGDECMVSDGDALQLAAEPEADAKEARLVVLANKGGKECAKSATVTVEVTDLQEMQNHLRETVDQGMQELRDKQGKSGLPAAPASATAAPVQTEFAKNAPPAEKDGAADVNQQLAEADNVEKEAAKEAPQEASASAAGSADAGAAPAQTVNIELGQTVAQVTASLGQPISIIDLGTKKVYKYKDMKITFKAGKVADVD